ncbi:MAG: hypothetical protein ACRC6U_09345 [Fusobacteriaceae bacterium]
MEISDKLNKFLLEKLHLEVEELEDKLKIASEIAGVRNESIRLLEERLSKTTLAVENTNKANSNLERELCSLNNTKLYHVVELQKRNSDINLIHEANKKLIKENEKLKRRLIELEKNKK